MTYCYLPQKLHLQKSLTLGEQRNGPLFDWFVDSSISSSGDGKSPAQAFKTFAEVIAAVGSLPNQRIGLACNAEWKEQLSIGSPGNHVDGTEIGYYGSSYELPSSGATADAPFIDASDTIPNANFTLVGGTSFTYQATVNFTTAPGAADQRLIWENDKCLTQVAYSAGVELATPGTFAYSSYTANSATVYVRASDSSAIPSNGKKYDYPNRLECINIYGANCRITNIRTRRQRDNNGSCNILGGDYGWIVNCTMEDGHKHSSYLQEGGGWIGCMLKNNYNGTSGSPNFLVANKNVGTGLGVTVQNNTFISDPNIVPAVNITSSFLCHTSVSGNFGTITASGNSHTYSESAYVPQNITAINVSGDIFLNCKGTGNDNTENLTGLFSDINFTVNVTTISSVNGPFNSLPPSGRSTITHVNCTFSTATYEPCTMSGNNVDATFTNCSFSAGDTSARFPHGLIRMTGTGCTLTVNGTTLQTGLAADSFFNMAADTVYAGDNNHFIKTGSGIHFQRANSDVATSLAAWQAYTTNAAVGHDANSTLV